jgi:hypothetical protein
MSGRITIDRATVERLHGLASSASRLIGHIDALATGPLADHVDTIAYELGELLGNPHLIAAPVPSARSTFALDVVLDGVPELVAPDALTASRTHALTSDDGARRELATDDESTRPHVRQLRATHGRQCQRVVRQRRAARRRQRLGIESVLTTSGTKQVETGWGRFTIAAVLLALLGVLALLTLGACQVDTAPGTTLTVPAIHARAVCLPGELATEGP